MAVQYLNAVRSLWHTTFGTHAPDCSAAAEPLWICNTTSVTSHFWLSQVLSQVWPLEIWQKWWADKGSNKAVREQQYLNNVYGYILRQRATPQVVCVR